MLSNMPLGRDLVTRGNVAYRGNAVLGKQLRGEAAERAQHGPAGVDHLNFAVARECLRVGRQTCRVPAVVTCSTKPGRSNQSGCNYNSWYP